MKIVYGPPGTGKTSYLIARMEEALARGVEPERVAFVSFTTAAVREALARAKSRFDLDAKQLPYFKTLHAIAFSASGIGRGHVMSNYSTFARDVGLRIRGESGLDAVFSSSVGTDDILLHAHQLCCSTQLSFEEVAKRYALRRVSAERFATFRRKLNDWKMQTHQLEYSDMLLRFLALNEPLPVDVAFIDEAQDLTPQQWKVVDVAFRDTKDLWIAGDDDQAIYRWAGAEVEHLLRMTGETIILNKSFRIPAAVKRIVDRIGTRISHRKTKDWRSTGELGALNIGGSLNGSPILDGSVMCLARTSYALRNFTNWAESHGIPYKVNGEKVLRDGEVEAYRALCALRRGEGVKASVVKKMLLRGDYASERLKLRSGEQVTRDMLSSEVLQNDHMVLRDISDSRRRFLRRIELRNAWSQCLDISTIHQAKGREADHVLLITTMSRATESALRSRAYADDEHRVWYVAASRARKCLRIIKIPGEFCYSVDVSH